MTRELIGDLILLTIAIGAGLTSRLTSNPYWLLGTSLAALLFAAKSTIWLKKTEAAYRACKTPDR